MKPDNLEDEAKKQVEAVRRSGKTNMFNLDNIKRISVDCGLPHLTDILLELDNEEFIEFMEESAEKYRGVDNEEIENMKDRIQNTRITKEI